MCPPNCKRMKGRCFQDRACGRCYSGHKKLMPLLSDSHATVTGKPGALQALGQGCCLHSGVQLCCIGGVGGYMWARSGQLCACYIIFCMFEILHYLKCFQVTSAWSPDPLSGSSRPSLASIRGQGWALGAWGQTFPCLDQALGEAEGLQGVGWPRARRSC